MAGHIRDVRKLTFGVTPPPEEAPKTVWMAILEPARARPGEWAIVEGGFDRGTAKRIKKGEYTGIDAGEFEARAGNPMGGSLKELFVRFDPTGGDKT